MDRVVALLRNKGVVAGLVLVLLAGGGVAWWATGGGDEKAEEPVAAPSSTTPTPTDEATTATPTPTPTPVETVDTPCEGPDTVINPEGDIPESLLPDCGREPVTAAQQEKTGLGLGCGGSYPIILFKTAADGVDSSVCGKDSSGADVRVIVQKDGESARDLDGRYDYTVDGFVAEDGDTTWTVQAYDGAVVARRDGRTASSGPGDWQSLDNEPDGD